MMIYRSVVVVALLVIGLGACATDEPELDNQYQDVSQDEEDVSSPDLDSGEDVGEGDDEDADGTEDAGDPDVSGEDTGGVDEDVENGAAPEGDSCQTAIDVTEGAVLTGESTVEMNDNYDPVMGADNCPGTNFSDRERVYVVVPAETTTYEVVAEPEDSFDLMLYARQDCAVDACVAGTRLNGPGGVEAMSFEATGGESVYIFVDGEIGHSGEFDLVVTIED